jgi:2'-5' RNA ligase
VRLFVAVACGADVTQQVAALIQRLRTRVAQLAPAARLTWASAERFHLTIRFIGEVDPETAAAIGTALRAPVALPAFDFTVAGLGVFPARGAARVLWAGVTGGIDGLRNLEREVSGRLAPLGLLPEKRPYAPHLTLARVRDAAGLRFRDLIPGSSDLPLGTAHADAITLFESRLSPKGAAYVALQRTPLLAG